MTTTNTLRRHVHPSPVGDLQIITSSRGLRAVLWPVEKAGRVEFDEDVVDADADDVAHATAAQLDEYFAGDRDSFDLPLDPVGTDFQREVWAGLSRIPHGETSSYGALADKLDRPGAARAVGAATGANPISIIVPCHRLVGASGKLTGFAGGLDTKRWLLEHERGGQLSFG
ncbi:MAG: methylated-DNA--[protein]-cysteine S-methyltransferase [Acidimicrobiales bacterium]